MGFVHVSLHSKLSLSLCTHPYTQPPSQPWVFSLSPFDAKHQQLFSLHLAHPLSIWLAFSLSFDDFKRFLECARAEVLLQLQRYTLPIGKACSRAVFPSFSATSCKPERFKERSSLPMHIFPLQRMIMSQGGNTPGAVNEIASLCNHRETFDARHGVQRNFRTFTRTKGWRKWFDRWARVASTYDKEIDRMIPGFFFSPFFLSAGKLVRVDRGTITVALGYRRNLSWYRRKIIYQRLFFDLPHQTVEEYGKLRVSTTFLVKRRWSE